jgi:SAM-dependent methyltransferase
MKLTDVISRRPPEPWAGADKIPWNDPAFSARMLREHLSQDHDRASRRGERIDGQVRWLHDDLLGGSVRRVLDLGCGPGLYAARLARLGHACVGIDYSPASIAHARSEAERDGLACAYQQRDLREGGFGSGFDLALLISGELNAFRPSEAAAILVEARRALVPGGLLVLEVHREHFVRGVGRRAPTWFGASRGLFADEPYVCLYESAWSDADRAAVERYLVVTAATAEVARYTSSLKAYSDTEYGDMLREAGFEEPVRHESLDGGAGDSREGLFVLVARGAP